MANRFPYWLFHEIPAMDLREEKGKSQMLPAASQASPINHYPGSHPMDSSRLLNSLVKLVRSSGPSSKKSANLVENIINLGVLRRLLSALCYRDTATLKHSRRVGILSVGIGTRLGWEDDELRLIEVASLLHDIGKIGIPDHILFKPGKLSPDEAEYIASHNNVAVELLQACHVDRDLIGIVAQSHGIDWNPTNQRGNETSLGSRILAVADAYESLTTQKVFRQAYSEAEALNILHDQSGKGFDRNVVAALERWLKTPEAESLEDEAAAEAAISANIPATVEATYDAANLCHLFQYVHLFENLYDAFYVVSEDRKVLMWSIGASRLFNFQAYDLVGQSWNRSIVATSSQLSDPLENAFEKGSPQCHSLNLKDLHGSIREFGVQSVPIKDEEGYIVAVAELVCDNNQSKKNRGQFRKLQMAATRDALTGVVNRGELDEQLQKVHQKWQAEKTIPYSVVFLDVDHFKSINDKYSHAVGDRVLIDIARLVQDELYSGEIIGRYGGEEFVILCPETPLETALERAERLRRAIAETSIAGREQIQVTASFGVSQIEEEDTAESVIKRADEALYEAKNNGRNRTCYRTIRKLQEKKNRTGEEKTKEWVHEAEIVTCVATSMLPRKLQGFVQDNQAKLIDVKETELTINVGSPPLLGGWGAKSDKQPVSVQIEIIDLPQDKNKSGTKRILLRTTSTPIGRPSKHEIFEQRAMLVVEALRSYLIAD